MEIAKALPQNEYYNLWNLWYTNKLRTLECETVF